jgi:hypothetical protein
MFMQTVDKPVIPEVSGIIQDLNLLTHRIVIIMAIWMVAFIPAILYAQAKYKILFHVLLDGLLI